jgi:hypothetical protein
MKQISWLSGFAARVRGAPSRGPVLPRSPTGKTYARADPGDRAKRKLTVLGGVDAALELVPARRGPLDARVVARGDRVGSEAAGAVEQRRELQVAVAVGAGQGRPAGRVLADEIAHHLLVELTFEVQDVVGDADRGRHAPRVVQVVNRAAAAERPLAAVAVRRVVQLHGQTDDVVALLDEQPRRHR